MLKCDGDEFLGILSLLTLCFQEKLLKISYGYLYRRTDTGGQGEYPKVSERTMVKELGKIPP